MTLLACFLLLVVEPLEVGGRQSSDDVVEKFIEGKALIEKNCATCYRATKDGLLRGISLVEEALQASYSDERDALLALEGGFRTISYVYTRRGTEEHADAIRHLHDVYERLLELEPNDVETRYAYAQTRLTDDEKMETYREVVRTAPEHAGARFAVGALLIRRGDVAQGVRELETALRLVDESDFEEYAENALAQASTRGLSDAERQLTRVISERREEIARRR